MLRKALVNDVVHSFCYVVRSKMPGGDTSIFDWPFMLLGRQSLTGPVAPFNPQILVPFVSYAYAKQIYTYSATCAVMIVSDYLRRFTEEERIYATQLMAKYYDVSTGQTE